jgi:1-acyl-sn-glycerol-3-phosphate acyltransferase
MSVGRSKVDVAAFTPPGALEFAAIGALLAPWRVLTDPRSDGWEHLPGDGRYLLVGNHTTLGLFDVPFLVCEVHARTGLLVPLARRAPVRLSNRRGCAA